MLNADKPSRWNADTALSVQQYNHWFLDFAPLTFRTLKEEEIGLVLKVFEGTSWLRDLTTDYLFDHPGSLAVLRMMCAPPIARERLAGLSGASKQAVLNLEGLRRLAGSGDVLRRKETIERVIPVVKKLLDRQLFPWLEEDREPTASEREVSLSVVVDRVCGNTTNPVLRNEQERRQLAKLDQYLLSRGYVECGDPSLGAFEMHVGTFAHHKNVPMYKNALDDTRGYVNTPIDLVVMPVGSPGRPVLVECKSAGDATNTNKRRKEEDTKVSQLRATYGDVTLYLFLCGYFESPYLGYEAANNMDWVWEHRIEDFDQIIPRA